MEKKDFGILAPWLINIKNVKRIYKEYFKDIEDDKDLRHKLMVELSVFESCMNLLNNVIV
jgi:hypothetical protein